MNIKITSSGENYVDIAPVRAVFYDSNNCNTMKATIEDNLSNSCLVRFYLMYLADDTFITLYHGTCTISGENYTNWDNSNEYIYQYVATVKGLTIL